MRKTRETFNEYLHYLYTCCLKGLKLYIRSTIMRPSTALNVTLFSIRFEPKYWHSRYTFSGTSITVKNLKSDYEYVYFYSYLWFQKSIKLHLFLRCMWLNLNVGCSFVWLTFCKIVLTMYISHTWSETTMNLTESKWRNQPRDVLVIQPVNF